MRLARVPLPRIVTVTVFLAVFIFAATLVISGTPLDEAVHALARAGIVVTLTGGFWGFYSRWGWKISGLRFGGWLSPYPDLNGRWEGSLRRAGESVERPFVIEVKQTFTTLSFTTYSRRSSGRSEVAFLTVDEPGSTFGVVAHWQARTGRPQPSPDDPDLKETFTGTSVWSLQYIDVPDSTADRLRIVDNYYTSRTPATAGVIELRRVSKRLRNAFK